MLRLARRAFALACAAAVLVAGSAGAQEVDARLSATRVAVPGEFTLTVVVSGGRAQGEPVFDLPEGIELLRQNRSQSFSWVNGRATTEVQFHYQLVARNAGRYDIGPIEVRVNDRRFRSGVLSIEAAEGPTLGAGGGGDEPATLLVDVIPREPWVGQATTLRTRLVQRATFAEDPQYLPPSATGFWSEPPTVPQSYYATSGGERVLVTETRARLFPLAAGEATIGEAVVQVVLGGGTDDPFGWPLGRAHRPVVLRSAPVPVRVRALPRGAPAGFGGAVGEFVATWALDKDRTTLDLPVLLTLEVRGVGNLPLVRAPELAFEGFDLFAGTSEDSAAAPGGPGLARRRFRWTVLARRTGAFTLELPGFSWFDPGRGAYRSLGAGRFDIVVDPAPAAAAAEPGGRIAGLRAPAAADAGAPRPRPWVFALGGLAAGLAIVLFGRARAPAPDANERAQVREWLRAIGMAKGPEFWSAAERGGAWLAARGEPVQGLEQRIASARYGGVRLDDDDTVRRQMVERLSRALPAVPARGVLAAGAIAALACAVLAVVLFGWIPAPEAPRGLLRAADSAVRRGDLSAAEEAWKQAWGSGVRTPGLAARLAAAAIEGGDVARASAWVLRGRHLDGRDPALGEAEARVRESGGLVGAAADGLPVRRIEWGVLGFVLGVLAGVAWWRRRLALALAGLALLAGAVPALEALARRNVREAVVREARLVGDEGLELQPGQAVRIVGPAGASEWAIEIARGTRARIPRSAVFEVEPAAPGEDTP